MPYSRQRPAGGVLRFEMHYRRFVARAIQEYCRRQPGMECQIVDNFGIFHPIDRVAVSGSHAQLRAFVHWMDRTYLSEFASRFRDAEFMQGDGLH